MMAWRLDFTEPADTELADAYLNRQRFTSEAEAFRWYEGLGQAIVALVDGPRRCSLVDPGDYGYRGDQEIRRLRYGSGRGAWHVVYRLIEPEEGDGDGEGIIRVLHVVSAVRRPPRGTLPAPPGQAPNEGEDE